MGRSHGTPLPPRSCHGSGHGSGPGYPLPLEVVMEVDQGTPPEVVMEVDQGTPPQKWSWKWTRVPPSQKLSWKWTRVPPEVVITEVVITEVDQGTPPRIRTRLLAKRLLFQFVD